LAQARAELSAAKAKDAATAKKLRAAQDELAESVARVAQGEADLAAQQKLIGQVVRTAYQQQSNLVSIALLLDSSDTSQIADRMQWTELVFGNTSGEMTRLEQLQTELEEAKAARTAAEAKVAEQKAQTEARLAETQQLANRAAGLAADAKQLTDEAAGREATVASAVKKVANLVEKNRGLRDAAEDELEATKAEYDKLQAQEASIAAKIKEQIAKDKADNKPRVNSMGFVRPLDANPGSPFGLRYHPILHYWRMHWGQDFGAKCGAPIWAMADGKVTQTLKTANSHGLGNWTVIDYGTYKGDHFSSGYAHQSKIIVKVGQEVKQGQIVGYVGTTGLSTGCHLHLQIYKNGTRVNPRPYV
jgi:murein DD-endopeptidase MepM/ murein hydrolase activator NlpD